MFAVTLPKALVHRTGSNRSLFDLLRRIRSCLRETWCALRGHDMLLHTTHDRICLRCATCGHQTPGWLMTNRTGAVSHRKAA